MLASYPDWIGRKYNVQVEWETGEITYEPLSLIAGDDPVTCAAYAKGNDLHALEGWHRFSSLTKKEEVLKYRVQLTTQVYQDIGNGKVEELISYNQLLEHLENAQYHDMGMDQDLIGSEPSLDTKVLLLASDPDWKGSKYNVQVEWETGEIAFEPLSIIAADNPVTCAACAIENYRLALEGWCRFKSLAKEG